MHASIRVEGEGLAERKMEETRKFEVEMLEKEILDLKGKQREEAMKAYRKLLSSLADEPIYFLRS